MWYAPLGFCIAFFGGWLISQVLNVFGIGGESTIYMDENKQLINADLFTPFIAKRIRKQNAKILETSYAVSTDSSHSPHWLHTGNDENLHITRKKIEKFHCRSPQVMAMES